MADALNSLRPQEYDRLSMEQSKLLVFQPLVSHSLDEMPTPFRFHPQILVDFLTVEELGTKMLDELRRARM
jgi:hypothetical protein